MRSPIEAVLKEYRETKELYDMFGKAIKLSDDDEIHLKFKGGEISTPARKWREQLHTFQQYEVGPQLRELERQIQTMEKALKSLNVPLSRDNGAPKEKTRVPAMTTYD